MSWAFQAGVSALQRGANEAAIQNFQGALSEDPDDPMAHALISIALSNAGRRYAAQVEAGRALALQPNLPIGHVARAYALILHHDYRAAAGAFDEALALDPYNLPARLGRCRMARARRNAAQLEAALASYRELAPDDPECDVLAAHLHLMRGNLDRAEKAALAALRGDPEDADGYTVMGWVHARRGDADKARHMALTALNFSPEDRDAHLLLAYAIMQRRPLVGYWQRFALWLSLGGALRIIAVLIGLWVGYRVAVAVLLDAGLISAATVLQLIWLGFVLMTWIAGFQYRRMVEREMERVELRPDF